MREYDDEAVGGSTIVQSGGSRCRQVSGFDSVQIAGCESNQTAGFDSIQIIKTDGEQKVGDRGVQIGLAGNVHIGGDNCKQIGGYVSVFRSGKNSIQIAERDGSFFYAGVGTLQVVTYEDDFGNVTYVTRVVTENEANKWYTVVNGIWVERPLTAGSTIFMNSGSVSLIDRYNAVNSNLEI